MCMHVSVCVCVCAHAHTVLPTLIYLTSDRLSVTFLITDEIYLEHYVAVADSMTT